MFPKENEYKKKREIFNHAAVLTYIMYVPLQSQ